MGGEDGTVGGNFEPMKLLRTLGLLLSCAVATHALGDRTVFDTTPPPPIPNPRAEAPFVVGLELGVNSLATLIGGRLSWYPLQQVALDLGGGWSGSGMRGGVGARYFLLKSFNSPFVGGAWMRSGGVDSASLDDSKGKYHVIISNIQYANALAGYEFRRPDGLTVVLTTGWSFALTPEKDRWTKKSGTLSADAQDMLDYYTGSGPIASVIVGYGF